ncbi:MAG: VWA domain-containing protein [Chlamydiales bacterium]
MKKRPLVATSLLISLSLHLFFLFFLARNPLLLQNRFASLFRKGQPPLELMKAEEDELLRQAELEEVFDTFVAQAPTPFDFYHKPAGETKSPAQEAVQPLTHIAQASALQDQGAHSALITPPSLATQLDRSVVLEQVEVSSQDFLSQIAFDKQPSTDHKKALTASLALDPVETVDDLGMDSLAVSASIESKLPALSALESFTQKAVASTKLFSEPVPSEPKKLQVNDTHASDPLLLNPPALQSEMQKPFTFQKPSSLPGTDNYLLPEVANAAPWDQAFDVKVELLANPNDTGVIFSINLTPVEGVVGETMPHNFYFLIDRSSSVQRHRFASYKRAVVKALACLRDGDKFNILLFDKKVKRLSERTIPFSKASRERAEQFLEQEEFGGMFAAADLYSVLDKIIPANVSEAEAHTAILITDGDSTQPPAKQQKQISQWLSKNAGKVALYAAAVGKENNLIMLDLLSSASGGELIYSDTYAAFPRKLGKLLLDLRGPLVKELLVTAEAKDGSSSVQLYPASSAHPTLFAKRPYEIIGSALNLSDFTLQIQGKYKDQWVTITKEVSLKRGTKGTRLLEKKWAAVRAQSQYDNFLKEGKVAHLLKAKEILKSSGHEIALE